MGIQVNEQGIDLELIERIVKERVDKYLEEKKKEEEQKPKKMALIAAKGTLDWAYPPFILATTAAAMGWEAGIFFTFYGLNILHKEKSKELKIAPLANPAMPVPVPNIVGAVPGMTQVGTKMMKWMFKARGMVDLQELIEEAVALGVKLFPCSITMGVFGYKESDFIEGCEKPCGAATFLEWAKDADITLFI
jgi:peroxiredoxin family protein